jgi:branched-chain amino acid transport system ATP-binding protein
VLGVLGVNGAGKSTLMRAIVGLIPVARGRVRFACEDESGLSAAARVRRGIGHVPEGRLLFPTLSIDDHLWLGANPARLTGASLRERTEEILHLFPILRERRRACAGVLSGASSRCWPSAGP